MNYNGLKISILILSFCKPAFSDELSNVEHHDNSNNIVNYSQNPYINLPSSNLSNYSRDEIESSNLSQSIFSSGKYSILGAASYVDQNGYNNYGYALNLFAQTGKIFDFSFGGLITLTNPLFSQQINPKSQSYQVLDLPSTQQIGPQELFIEFQHQEIIEADIGWIGIKNSPWMTYYQSNALNLVTYQGGIINIKPNDEWLISAFAINGAQLLGEQGFSQQTMYNSTWDIGSNTTNIGSQGSPSTFALGASFTSDYYNLRLWGYQFNNYSNLAYTDSSIKLPISNVSFTISLQAALQRQNMLGNILNNSGYGNSVDSNMVGTKLSVGYSFFELNLGYNNIWGPIDGFNAGGLISPYTYQYATDPLFTTGWLQGMVERSSGQAYKVSPSVKLIDSNLTISPSYQYYATTIIPASNKWDLIVSYNIPEIRGLNLLGVYGYLTNASVNANDLYQLQLMVSYLY